MKSIAFFGHRQIFDEIDLKTKLIEILKTLTEQGFNRMLIGCHGDFDNLVLSTCLKFKEEYNKNIEISVVLTSLSFLNKQKYGYSRANIYDNFNCETLFYDIEEVHYKKRIIISNEKMVDQSDAVICYVDMKSYKSGAKRAVEYALKQNKRVINLFK